MADRCLGRNIIGVLRDSLIKRLNDLVKLFKPVIRISPQKPVIFIRKGRALWYNGLNRNVSVPVGAPHDIEEMIGSLIVPLTGLHKVRRDAGADTHKPLRWNLGDNHLPVCHGALNGRVVSLCAEC